VRRATSTALRWYGRLRAGMGGVTSFAARRRLLPSFPPLPLLPLLPLLLLASAAGCGRGPLTGEQWRRIQTLSPLPPVPPDRSNRYRDQPAAVTLGRAFFFDARFSGPATQVDALGRTSVPARSPFGQATGVSCATCHDLQRGGADVTSVPGNVSEGAGWTDVNALPTINSAYNHLWFRNGRADSGWAVAAAVAESATTMNGNRLQTAWVIADGYRGAYEAIFGALPMAGTSSVPDPRFPLQGKPGTDAWNQMVSTDQTAINRVLVNWAKAIDAYQATLVSGETPFDRFVREGPASDAISAVAKRGVALFVGKAACLDCHAGPLLTDGDFHNVGVPQSGPEVPTVQDCPAGGPPDGTCDCVSGVNCLPWGARDGLLKLGKNGFLRTSVWSDDPNDRSRAADPARVAVGADAGAGAGAETNTLTGAWRTPSLRNVGLTAPYMHDGVYATLAEVVAHYNRGGAPGGVGVRAASIKPLLLSDDEQADLVAFLETLTDARGFPIPTTFRSTEGPNPTCPQGGTRIDQAVDVNRDGVLQPNEISMTGHACALAGVRAVTAGYQHTCAVMTDGTARCWGRGDYGQLGDGTIRGSTVPVAVAGLGGVTSIAGGVFHSCAALIDGTVWCWGTYGDTKLGGPPTPSAVPILEPGLSGTRSIASALYDTCTVSRGGAAICWGGGDASGSALPVTVGFLAGVVSIAAGCAVHIGGGVSCWGNASVDPVPADVPGLSAVASVSVYQKLGCALSRDGTVRCWGFGGSGMAPIPVSGLSGVTSGVTSVAVGAGHACAALSDGTARCWGANAAGQLGDGTRVDSSIPVIVAQLAGVVSITAGDRHSCAALTDGTVRCWGRGDQGQLGNQTGNGVDSPLPLPVLLSLF
jgi:cytochrome c peroxidase